MVYQLIYDRLVEVAKNGDTVAYSEIAPLAGLHMENPGDRQRISHILGEISEFEHKQGRPMLSAVVTFKDLPMPGGGFFEAAHQIGKYNGHTDMEALEFFVQELKRVHAEWQPRS